MIQGIRHSGAKKVIWKHNDLTDLESKLREWPKETPKIIAFESVYSMCGSVGPIKEICDLADKYGAITFLDEVCPARIALCAVTHLDVCVGSCGRTIWAPRCGRRRTSRLRCP
jgi:selenocysteine lyase/cysteine desulfurase